MPKFLKPIAPPVTPVWGIHKGIVEKPYTERTAQKRFIDLGFDMLKRAQKVAGYEDVLMSHIDVCLALSELDDDLAGRAWVYMCANNGAQAYD